MLDGAVIVVDVPGKSKIDENALQNYDNIRYVSHIVDLRTVVYSNCMYKHTYCIYLQLVCLMMSS